MPPKAIVQNSIVQINKVFISCFPPAFSNKLQRNKIPISAALWMKIRTAFDVYNFVLCPAFFFLKSFDDHVAAQFWKMIDKQFAVAVVGFV